MNWDLEYEEEDISVYFGTDFLNGLQGGTKEEQSKFFDGDYSFKVTVNNLDDKLDLTLGDHTLNWVTFNFEEPAIFPGTNDARLIFAEDAATRALKVTPDFRNDMQLDYSVWSAS